MSTEVLLVESVARCSEGMWPAGALSGVVVNSHTTTVSGTSGQTAGQTVDATQWCCTEDMVPSDEGCVSGWWDWSDGRGTTETFDSLVVLTESFGDESVARGDVGVEPAASLSVVVHSEAGCGG